jgi:hypothetical protein
MSLTDTAIRALKPREKRCKVSDGQGLHLKIQASDLNPVGLAGFQLHPRAHGNSPIASTAVKAAVASPTRTRQQYNALSVKGQRVFRRFFFRQNVDLSARQSGRREHDFWLARCGFGMEPRA